MNRRQFFKTLAATAAGIGAAVVAPAVLGESDTTVEKWTGVVNGKTIEITQDQYDEIYHYAIQDIIKMMEAPDFLDHD